MDKYEITEAAIITYNKCEYIAEISNINPIGMKFDKDDLLDYVVWLTCAISNYDQLTLDIAYKNKKIGINSAIEFTNNEEYVFVVWIEDGEQTYYEFDVIKEKRGEKHEKN